MHRRTSPGRRKSSPLRWLGWLAAVLVAGMGLLILLAPTLTTRLIRAYLQHEDFRQKAEVMLSALTGGKAQISSLAWHDDSVSANEFHLENAHGWDAEATGAHAALNFGAIRNGVWSLENVGADELRLRPSPSPAQNMDTAASHSSTSGTEDALADEKDTVPFFLRRYFPTRTDISGVDVQRFFLEHSGWRIDESRLHAGAWSSGRTALPFTLSGGTLQVPLVPPEQAGPLKLDIDKGTLRLSEGQIQLSNARLRWKEASQATLRGSIKFENSAWQTLAHVQAVPVAEFLSTWWKQRLTGQLKADLEFSGRRGAPLTWKADAVLENGVLQGLPLLETLAAYTRVERFKRLVLDTCQASLRPQGEAVHIHDIVIQSNGLLRIEGTLTLQGRAVNGDFLVGVTNDTLRWLPGAQNRVFVETNPQGQPGLHWARVHVAGTLDAPQEDLSSRLLGGAGMALLFDTPSQIVNQSADALLTPVLGEEGAKLPGKVMEGASGVLEQGVKTGADLLNQVLPVFPGGK